MVFLALLCFSLIRIAALLALSHYEVCRLLVCRITRFFAYWVCRILTFVPNYDGYRLQGLSQYPPLSSCVLDSVSSLCAGSLVCIRGTLLEEGGGAATALSVSSLPPPVNTTGLGKQSDAGCTFLEHRIPVPIWSVS